MFLKDGIIKNILDYKTKNEKGFLYSYHSLYFECIIEIMVKIIYEKNMHFLSYSIY